MVEMKYTKFVIGAIKERIFGKPDPNTEITVKGKKVNLKEKKKPKKRKSDAIKWPKIRLGRVSSITGVITPIIMLMVGLTVFSNVSSAINVSGISPGISSMMNLIPLVLVAAAVLGIVTTAFRITM